MNQHTLDMISRAIPGCKVAIRNDCLYFDFKNDDCRVEVDVECRAIINLALELCKGRTPTRVNSLVITKLEEALMWDKEYPDTRSEINTWQDTGKVKKETKCQ